MTAEQDPQGVPGPVRRATRRRRRTSCSRRRTGAAKTVTFADRLEKASRALSAYEGWCGRWREAEVLQRRRSRSPRASPGDEHWRRDQKKRDHNDRRSRTSARPFRRSRSRDGLPQQDHRAGGRQQTHSSTTAPRSRHFGYSAARRSEPPGKAPWGSYAEPEYTGLDWAVAPGQKPGVGRLRRRRGLGHHQGARHARRHRWLGRSRAGLDRARANSPPAW